MSASLLLLISLAALPVQATPSVIGVSPDKISRLESQKENLLRSEDELLKDIHELKAQIKELNRKLAGKYFRLDDTRFALKEVHNELVALT